MTSFNRWPRRPHRSGGHPYRCARDENFGVGFSCANGTAIIYDADGNMLSDGVHSYTWNARNQLAMIDSGSTGTFVYDPFGRRVSKSILGGAATSFFYDGANPVQELSGTTPTANLLTGGR